MDCELLLTRKWFSEMSTIGELYFPGDAHAMCFTLEDTDRGLTSTMNVDDIKKLKVPGETCIPYGTYEVVKYFSPHFGMWVLLLKDVKGYEGAEVHPGNKPADTHGCILPGIHRGVDIVLDSRKAFEQIMCRLDHYYTNGAKVILKIVKEG